MVEWGSASVRIGDDVAWTSNGSRVVALPLAEPGTAPCVLEGSAAVIWEEIAESGPLRVERLLERLSEMFEVGVDVIRTDVEALISDLTRLRLMST